MRTATTAAAILFAMVCPEPGRTAEPEVDQAHVKTAPAESRATAEKEISDYVARLGEAIAAESVLRIVPLVDAEQMTEMIVASIRNKRLAAAMRESFGNRMIGHLASGFARSVTGWDRHQTSKMTIAESLDIATVTLRVWDQESYSNRIQCWLIRRKSGWKLYDFNELGLGLRMTQLVLVTLDQMQVEGVAFSANDARNLQLAVFSLHGEDYEAADKHLRLVENRKMPTLLESIKWTVISLVATGLGDNERVLMALDRCAKLGRPFPIADYLRAVAHNQLGNHEEALAAADRFLKTFGEDADALYERGLALEWLDRNEEAIDAYRRGLDDTPGSAENLVGMGLLLQDDQKNEIATRFAASPHPAARFDDIAYGFAVEDDMAALAVITAAMKKIDADDLNVPYYEAELATSREDHVLAAKILGDVLPKITDEEQRPYYLERFLDASLEAEQAVAAYQQVPEKEFAFEYLADELSAASRSDELTALIDKHRRDYPNDPITWYFTGELHYDADEYENADAAFSKALTLEPDEYYAESIVRYRVYCWYNLGKGLDAYGQIKPDDETFATLADLYFDDEKLADIETLIGRHEKTYGVSAVSVYWQGRIHWSRHEYEKCVAAVVPHFNTLAEELEEWEFSATTIDVVRCLIRLDRASEAPPILDAVSNFYLDPLSPLLVDAALGRIDEASRRLDEGLEDEWWPSQLIDDEDLNRVLQTSQATPLRRRLVRALIDENRTDGFAMLLEKPAELTIDQIKSAAKRLWDVDLIETDELPPDAAKLKQAIIDDGDGWYRIWADDNRFAITGSEGPRYRFPDTFAAEIHESDTRNLFKQHKAVLGLNVVGPADKDKSWRMASRLLIALTEDAKPLLVESLSTGHLSVWNDSLKEGMLGDDPLRAVQSAGTVPAADVDDASAR